MKKLFLLLILVLFISFFIYNQNRQKLLLQECLKTANDKILSFKDFHDSIAKEYGKSLGDAVTQTLNRDFQMDVEMCHQRFIP